MSSVGAPLVTKFGAFTKDAMDQILSGFTFQGLFQEFSQTLIVAFAGGGQANATQITGQTAKVTTVATAGDSVKLPPAAPGLDIMLINRGANPMQVFGSGADVIDGQAAAVGVSQMQNSVCIYVSTFAGFWETEGLATGFGGPGLQTLSSQDNLVAKAGGGQGGGPAINRMMNTVAIVATAADSITLPASYVGGQITVINRAAANSMNVFPAVGENINLLAANTAIAVPAGTMLIFNCTTAGTWFTK
jgi:hypothetical protein